MQFPPSEERAYEGTFFRSGGSDWSRYERADFRYVEQVLVLVLVLVATSQPRRT
jgi:hypothetical protein